MNAVQYVVAPLGAELGTLVPATSLGSVAPGTFTCFKAPSAAYGGGITIVSGRIQMNRGTLAAVTLVDGGTAALSNLGTALTFAAGTYDTAKLLAGATPTIPYFLQADRYLCGIVPLPAGTVSMPATLTIGYIMGK